MKVKIQKQSSLGLDTRFHDDPSPHTPSPFQSTLHHHHPHSRQRLSLVFSAEPIRSNSSFTYRSWPECLTWGPGNAPRSSPWNHRRGQCSWGWTSLRKGCTSRPSRNRRSTGPAHSLPLESAATGITPCPHPPKALNWKKPLQGQGGVFLNVLVNFVPSVEQNCCKRGGEVFEVGKPGESHLSNLSMWETTR